MTCAVHQQIPRLSAMSKIIVGQALSAKKRQSEALERVSGKIQGNFPTIMREY
jgi:hypothetical protein